MIICNKTMTPEQILQKNEVQIGEVNGVYFMADNGGFSGRPIFTFQLNNNKRKRVKLKTANVTSMLCYLAGKNITFLNIHTNQHLIAHIDNKSYRSFFNEAFFIFNAIIIFIIGIAALFSKENSYQVSSIWLIIRYIFGSVCIFCSWLFLFHQSVRIEADTLILKGPFRSRLVKLCDIAKVTISSLGKGDVIEVLTNDYDYYYFPINGGHLKNLIRDLNRIGIDASYGYLKPTTA